MHVTTIPPFLLAWLLGFAVVIVRGLPLGTGDKLSTLKLFTSAGLNGTVHVDDDGFLQLGDSGGRDEDAIHDVVKYYVVAIIGTDWGLGMYSLAIDTTRTATWMQCVPCSNDDSSCFVQEPPPFDPSDSPTFEPHPLATFCAGENKNTSSNDSCEFHTSRPDGMAANGLLVQDNLIVFAANHNPSFSYGFPFGCVHNSVGFHSHGVMAGVLTLGKSRVSFAGINGVQQFSYCLAPPTGQPQEHYGFLRLNLDVPDTAHMHRIKFHDDDDVSQSPGNVSNSSYFVNLVGVSVAGARLPGITRETFQQRATGGGTVINPGVSTMIMVRAAYDALERALEDHLIKAPSRFQRRVVSRSGYNLCVNGSTHTVQPDMPSVTLHFDGGVDLELGPQQMFVGTSSEVTCLAVVPGSMTVIGALQQMNMRFTYDLTQDTYSPA